MLAPATPYKEIYKMARYHVESVDIVAKGGAIDVILPAPNYDGYTYTEQED